MERWRVGSEVVRAALVAAASALLVAVLAPPGGDSAAHLYRTLLVRDGVAVWDNLWFGGHYPLASYSFLYYLPTAIVGNVPVVIAGVVIAAALFASTAHHEWGDAARWPSRAFAVLAAGPLFTGTYSYALGLAAGLGTLRLLQARRPIVAVLAAALSLGFSPLAFAFLVIALAAVVVARRPRARRLLVVGGGVAALALVEVLTLVLFPSDGRYPFSPLSLFAVLIVCGLGAALALRSEKAAPLAMFFGLWALVNVVAFAVPSPFGDNLTRLRAVVFALVLLTAAVVEFRPRPLALGALAFALVYNLAPDVSALPKRLGDRRTAEEAFWVPALEVAAASAPAHRVEVVPTFGHWEAYWVPRAGLALARGWYRQIDLAENPELYREPLSPRAYRFWLRRMGVRHVLLPRARLGPMGADREAALLRSGRSGLRRVLGTADWTIYELPHATPILTGPGSPALARFTHDRISGSTTTRGPHRLRVRYTPYWRAARGDICLERAADGMTNLYAKRPGRFTLVVDATAGALARAGVGSGSACEV